MIQRTLLFAILAPSLFADFSYRQTSKITGGALAGMMKFAGAFSKQAREPMVSTVLVKGSRMAHVSAHQAQVIDLDSETITHIDFDRKQYSVMTFAEMQQALQQASEQMKRSRDADVHFTISSKDTGATKQISGFDTHEMILNMRMEGTDKKTGNTGGLEVNADMWVAPRVSGYDEVAEFYKKMANKMAWNPGASMFAGFAQSNPDISRGMGEVYKESAKLNGMPVYEVITIGGNMQGQAAPGAGAPQADGGEHPSAAGALAGALGGRFGLGKKKKAQQEEPQTASASGALIEMTTELSGFSSSAVDSSKFDPPAGFQKVNPQAMQPRRR